MRRRGLRCADQLGQDDRQVAAAVESIFDLSEVAIGVLGEIERMLGSGARGLQITEEGIDCAKFLQFYAGGTIAGNAALVSGARRLAENKWVVLRPHTNAADHGGLPGLTANNHSSLAWVSKSELSSRQKASSEHPTSEPRTCWCNRSIHIDSSRPLSRRGRSIPPKRPVNLPCTASDITCIVTDEGWSLATVIDLFSHQVMGRSMKEHMQTSVVTDAHVSQYQLRSEG